MAFWSRHLILILLCIVLPLSVAFYQDTQAAIDRSEAAGTQWAKAAPATLVARLKLEAHKTVSTALSIAQQITDERLMDDLAKAARKPIAVRSLISILNQHASDGGFAWAVTESGAVIARNGQTDVEEAPDHITGVPLFIASQEGFALDGLYEVDGKLSLVGVVPLVDGRAARGAVFVGTPLAETLMATLTGGGQGTALSLVVDDKIVATTHAQQKTANELVRQVGDSAVPVLGGRLEQPLESGVFPFTPLFVERDLEGLAHTTVSMNAPGAPNIRWVLSIASGESLRDLAPRQENFLSLLLVALLLSVVFGLMMQRTFAKPIDTLIDHLSEIQMKHGVDRELEEFRVSAPFKRLVKLINMTVNKLPAPNAIPSSGSIVDMPIVATPAPRAESTVVPVRGNTATGMPAAAMGVPGIPPAMTGAAPLIGDHGMSVLPMGGGSPTPFPGMPNPSEVPGAGFMSEPPMPSGVTAAEPPMPGGMPIPGPAAAPPMAMPAPAAPPMPAMPPMGMGAAPPMGGGMPVPGGMPMPATDGGGAAAMLQQIASLQASSSGNAAPPPMQAKSAADIRGLPSSDLAAEAPGGGNDTVAGIVSPLDVPPAPPVFGAAESPMPAPASFEEPPLPSGARMGGSALGSAALGSAGMPQEQPEEEGGFPSESTVVAKVAMDLLEQTRAKTTGGHSIDEEDESEAPADRTVIAMVPKDLIEQSAASDSQPAGSSTPSNGANGVDGGDHAHFKETYERFIEMRRNCGEPTADLSFDRFVAKLRKNRDGLIRKYSCKTVRFQVYEKDGKAALKATPIRG